jgi:hypothetical protein
MNYGAKMGVAAFRPASALLEMWEEPRIPTPCPFGIFALQPEPCHFIPRQSPLHCTSSIFKTPLFRLSGYIDVILHFPVNESEPALPEGRLCPLYYL